MKPTVRSCMTPEVLTLHCGDSLAQADAALRTRGTRRPVPVMGKAGPVGWVWAEDVARLKILAAGCEAFVPLEEAMQQGMVVCSPESSADEIHHALLQDEATFAVVLEGRRVVGLVDVESLAGVTEAGNVVGQPQTHPATLRLS